MQRGNQWPKTERDNATFRVSCVAECPYTLGLVPKNCTICIESIGKDERRKARRKPLKV